MPCAHVHSPSDLTPFSSSTKAPTRRRHSNKHCGRSLLHKVNEWTLEVALSAKKLGTISKNSLKGRITLRIRRIWIYIINKSMCALWLINQLWFIVPVNSWKNRASSELLYKSNRPQIVMGYRLINHLGCWKNTWRIRKSQQVAQWDFPILSVVEWFRALDLKSGGPWFESSTLLLSGFVLGSPEFNSSTTLCK